MSKNESNTVKGDPEEIIEDLKGSKGYSEHVIVVVVDIRGFSEFSKRQDSANVATFIKKVYTKLIEDYFSEAEFIKTTGDGLLITFSYSDESVEEISKNVVDWCLNSLINFPNILEEDYMINFQVPENIGIGIARGTACCIRSDERIIDYSGHLLNLANRLMELARPSGIVIEGSFSKELIPENIRGEFEDKNVYIRSIAEDEPLKVLYLKNYVEFPKENLVLWQSNF